MSGPDPSTVPLFLVLAAPVAGAVLALLPSGRASEVAARSAALVSVAAAVALIVGGVHGTWGPYLGLDALSEVFLLMVTSVYATSAWYSARYLRSVQHPFLSPQVYYSLLGAFAFAMVGSLVVTDLGLIWIGIEATTVASALLIVLERRPASVEAAWRYTLIASAGLTIALLALLMLYTVAGSLNLSQLAAHPPAVSLPLEMVVALALVGFGTKVGLFPMHTWLPDAHSEAPSPVSAMFSGVLLPTALYAFLRVYLVVPAPVPPVLTDLLIAFGVATALVAAFLLQRQHSYKRLLAYSSMEVMGIALVGVAVGGIALYGVLVLLLAHAFAKSAAFYCAGNVLQSTGTTRIAEVSGLRDRLPWTGVAWILSGAAVTGAPPFGTFVGELLIVAGAVAAGYVWLAVVLVVAIAVAFLGVNSQIGRMVLGDPRPSSPSPAGAGDSGVGVIYLNVVLAAALGVASWPYLTPILRSATTLLGGSLP